MTNKPRSGTLSTKSSADKKLTKVVDRVREYLGKHRLRIHPHANLRMAQRRVLYYEVLQALSKGRHEPKRDRYSDQHKSWEYSFVGKTIDDRVLRIGIAFELDHRSSERILVVTVIDPENEE